jgi:hypothetical protein
VTAVVGAPAELAPAPPAPRSDSLRRWGWTAVGTTAAAGVLHVLAAIDHLGAGELVVAFFLVTALGQLAAAGALAVATATGRRPASGPLAGLLAITVALLVLYLLAHTTDLLAGFSPADAVGPEHEHPEPTGPVALGAAPTRGEPPGVLGTATVTLELLSVLAFTALLPPRVRRSAGNVLAVVGGAVWLLWLTGVLG